MLNTKNVKFSVSFLLQFSFPVEVINGLIAMEGHETMVQNNEGQMGCHLVCEMCVNHGLTRTHQPSNTITCSSTQVV